MKKNRVLIHYKGGILLSLLVIASIGTSFISLQPYKASAQASCTNLSTGYGVANYNFTSVTAGAQSLWLRVKGSDSSPALKFNLSGGGTSCDQTLTTTSATSWKWVKSRRIIPRP